MFKLLAALIVPLALLAPNAAAHQCPEHVESIFLAQAGIHVSQEPGVYQETNRVAGLQTTAGACTDDNGREYAWDADTKIV